MTGAATGAPVKFTKFLRAPIQFLISKNICERLLLKRNICVKWVNVEEKMRKMQLRNEKLGILNLIYNPKFRLFRPFEKLAFAHFAISTISKSLVKIF